MSLDVILMKKCDPVEAYDSFDVLFFEELKNIQPTGFLNAKRVTRIGRNCLGNKWHRLFDAEKCPPMIFLPENWTEIKKWLKKHLARPDSYFEEPPADGWDFIYVCW